MKKNTHILLIVMISTIFMTFLYVTDEKVEHDYISVEAGDTLWSLAEHYRGKMDAQQWIAYVKANNNLTSNTIQTGAELYIPIEKQSVYIAQKEKGEQPVEVASDF